MTTEPTRSPTLELHRRQLLKAGGALVVSFALPSAMTEFSGAADAAGRPLYRPLDPAQLDSYLAIDKDGLVTAFFGKMDMGQGVDVAIAQIVADELDVPLDHVGVIMGNSALTVNQGGGSGSTAVELGAKPLRNAAAEARSVLLTLAGKKLNIPKEQMAVVDGVIRNANDSSQKVSYGELIGGHYFDVTLDWNGQYGNFLYAEGQAKPKSPSDYKIVGKGYPRRDIPEIVFGKHEYIVDVRVPGMMHGRTVRPPKAGAVPVKVDAYSIEGIDGARVVHEKDFLGIVAETEWGAIQASRKLKVTWSDPEPAFPKMDQLYDHIRKAKVTRESAGSGFNPQNVPPDVKAFEAAAKKADRVVAAEYEFPFQSHASLGPACAVVDYRGDSATVWTGSQKSHYTAEGVAAITGLPKDAVRSIWRLGPGSYGRNDAGDAAIDAAVMSKAVGRPVRVQGMRFEGSGWDPKAPASVHFAKAALDKRGNVLAYLLRSKGFSAGDIAPNESNPSDSYAGQLMGWPNDSVPRFGNPEENYTFPIKVLYWQSIPALLEKASPLRTAHMRDPLGPQDHFASESFVDEIAFETGMDPIEFRLKHLKEPRDVGVLQAAANKADWKKRQAGPKSRPEKGTVSGRGIAYTRRGNTVAAVIAEVEVDLDKGRIWPKKFTVAADQGLIVNPLWLKRTIEGNIVMACSRSLREEVRFAPDKVTSVDWITYPILDMNDAPEEIDIVLLNHTDLPPYGAGEGTTRPVAAAIANAFFDATGIRLRRAPFTPDRVKNVIDTHRA